MISSCLDSPVLQTLTRNNDEVLEAYLSLTLWMQYGLFVRDADKVHGS